MCSGVTLKDFLAKCTDDSYVDHAKQMARQDHTRSGAGKIDERGEIKKIMKVKTRIRLAKISPESHENYQAWQIGASPIFCKLPQHKKTGAQKCPSQTIIAHKAHTRMRRRVQSLVRDSTRIDTLFHDLTDTLKATREKKTGRGRGTGRVM